MQEKRIMKPSLLSRLLLPAFAAAVLIAPVSRAVAGPCAQMLEDTQAAVDRAIADIASGGPTAPEGDDALLSHDPTPDKLAETEAAIGDGIEPEKALAALDRARKADEANDLDLCQKNLAEARDAIGLQ